MAVTIKDLARLAGVSRGTVDRALNNRDGVHPDTRRRILEMARQYNYTPNPIAKTLKAQSRSISIGIVMPSPKRTLDFYSQIQEGIDDAVRAYDRYGITFHTAYSAYQDVEEQLAAIRSLYDKGVNGLAIAPINCAPITQAVNEIADAGIPVVTFNTDLFDSRRLCFVGQDHLLSGKVAGHLMGKICPRSGKILIINGLEDVYAHTQRVTAFYNLIWERYPDLEILDTLYTEDDDGIGYRRVSRYFEATPQVDGVYIAAGGVTGALQALYDTRRIGGLKVICYDFLPHTVELCKNGFIDFVIGQEPYMQGYVPIRVLTEYLHLGKAPESPTLHTDIDIRVRDNIDMRRSYLL